MVNATADSNRVPRDDVHSTEPSAPAETPPRGNPALEHSLAELRSGRRLDKVTYSVESFLLSQVTRLEKSLEQCKAAVDQNQIVQRILADHERHKEVWERERQAEIQRLFEASEKLARGWKQLEEERQNWIADRPPGLAGKSS